MQASGGVTAAVAAAIAVVAVIIGSIGKEDEQMMIIARLLLLLLLLMQRCSFTVALWALLLRTDEMFPCYRIIFLFATDRYYCRLRLFGYRLSLFLFIFLLLYFYLLFDKSLQYLYYSVCLLHSWYHCCWSRKIEDETARCLRETEAPTDIERNRRHCECADIRAERTGMNGYAQTFDLRRRQA